MERTRKYKMVMISPDLVESWITSSNDKPITITIDGVPIGTRVLSFHYNIERDVTFALCEHESFDDVRVGHEIPIFLPTVTVHRVENKPKKEEERRDGRSPTQRNDGTNAE